VIPGAAAPVLKEKEWNKVKLPFRGDAVSLAVNGTDAAKLTIPADGTRLFGLFHYSDRSACRVRKIVYRGDWPKVLARVDDQELANGPAGFQPPVEAGLETKLAVKLDQSFDKLAEAGVKRAGDQKLISSVGGGTRINLPAGQPRKPGDASVIHEKAFKGDFDVSLKISDTKLVFPKDGWGTGLDFSVHLADPNNTRVAVERRVLKDGRSILHAVRAHKAPDGEDKYAVWSVDTDMKAGTLRMVRQGGRVWYLYALDNSTDFTLLTSMEAGDADIRFVTAGCQSGDTVSGVDVVLRELTIKARP
jgi:hypothetical protein